MCRSHKQSKQQQKEEAAKAGDQGKSIDKSGEMGSLGKREHPVSPSPSPALRLLLLTCDATAPAAAAVNCCSHLPLIRSRIFQ